MTATASLPPGSGAPIEPRALGRGDGDPTRLAPLTPFGESAGDDEKRRALRRMKRVALGLLGFAALVYFTCRYLEHSGGEDVAGWVGYVRAASEAGMVGALADWFAVTALFRHPLGIPIPHTAIIRKKKDQLGDALGDFVENNFLSEDLIAEKVASVRITERVGSWMADPANADRLGEEASKFVKTLSEVIPDEDVEAVFRNTIIKKLAEPEWGPPLGRMLQQFLDEGRQTPLINLLADRAHGWAIASGPLIDRVVDKDAPGWSPKFVNALLGEKIHRELIDFTAKVRDDPNHELRTAMSQFLVEFAADLQTDPATMAKVERLKDEVLGREEVSRAARAAWITAKRLIEAAVDDPDSTLRLKFTESATKFGRRLLEDARLQTRSEYWIDRGARHLTRNYSNQVISIISETVGRWDADEASQKIELQVGRDLQFIRINGTVVGSIAGLVIYTVSELVF